MLAALVADVLDDLATDSNGTPAVATRVAAEVAELARRFPIYAD